MSSKRNETSVQKVGNPSFLVAHAGKQDTSVEALKEHRVISKARVVQGTSAEDLKTGFGEGAIVLLPGGALIASANEPFEIVPLFFFIEFCTWSDRKDKQSPKVRDRSMDPTSVIAKKSRDNKARFEKYGDNPDPEKKFTMRHVEHFNFGCIIYGEHSLAGTPFVLSFEKGEYNTGKAFISAICMRKIQTDEGPVQAPLWAQRWTFKTSRRSRNDNNWYGFDFTNPPEPYIKETDVEGLKNLHLELADLLVAKKIIVDHEGAGTDDDEAEVEAAATGVKF